MPVLTRWFPANVGEPPGIRRRPTEERFTTSAGIIVPATPVGHPLWDRDREMPKPDATLRRESGAARSHELCAGARVDRILASLTAPRIHGCS
jgi:hypothetical protein